MQRRDDHQRRVIDDFDRLARLDLRLEQVDIPNWTFTSFNYPYALVKRLYRALKEHGITFNEYMDQPAEYWDDMETAEALYNTRYHENLPEAERKRKRDMKDAG